MARRKRYIRGKIYITNDSLFSHDRYSKSGRRIVAVNNDRKNMHVVKIKGLTDSQGNRRNGLIPIEKNSVLTKPSGLERKVYTKTARGKPIIEQKLKKTGVRLNKWDMKKLPK